VVEELRQLGHDVLTIQETGKAGQRSPDEEVLMTATEAGRIVLTLNRKHFFRLHREHPDHAGIVACTVDQDFVRQASRIHEAVQAAGDLNGQLIRVNRPSS
jgi:hypothetical protein